LQDNLTLVHALTQLNARLQNGMTGGFAKGMKLRAATGWAESAARSNGREAAQ